MVSACLPSDALSQHLLSYWGFSFLGRGVSPPGPHSWPWMWGVSSCCSSAAQPIENIDIHLRQGLKRHAYNNSGYRCCKVELPSFPNFFYFISKARWLEYKITSAFELDGASLRLRGLRVHLRCKRPWFDPWVRKIPWRREWQATPVFLPGEFCGQRSLVGYSPWGLKESGTTEQPTHNTLWTWLNWDFLSWSEWSKHIRRCKYLEEKNEVFSFEASTFSFTSSYSARALT